MTDEEDRFWDKVRIGDGCWEWTATVTNPRYGKGYGRFWGTGSKRHRMATHYAWKFQHGHFPPEGMKVCHTCDNPPCVRPGHLMVRKGRSGRGRSRNSGSSHGLAKINEETVVTIFKMKANGVRQVAIASQLGISQATVSLIVNGRAWKHVSPTMKEDDK